MEVNQIWLSYIYININLVHLNHQKKEEKEENFRCFLCRMLFLFFVFQSLKKSFKSFKIIFNFTQEKKILAEKRSFRTGMMVNQIWLSYIYINRNLVHHLFRSQCDVFCVKFEKFENRFESFEKFERFEKFWKCSYK